MTASKSNLPRPHGVSIAEWMGTADEYVEGDGDVEFADPDPDAPDAPADPDALEIVGLADPTTDDQLIGASDVADLAAVLGGDPTK